MKLAVEWLQREVNTFLTNDQKKILKNVWEQAKEMEKEQIMNAFDECGMWQDNYSDSEHYYNKTFKSE